MAKTISAAQRRKLRARREAEVARKVEQQERREKIVTARRDARPLHQSGKVYGRPKKRRRVHLKTLGMRMEVIEKARIAMAGNFAFPCSLCFKLHRNMDRGMFTCEEKEQGNCSGPLDGQSFPFYEGPLDDEAIASHCIRCGMPEAEDRADYDRDGKFLRYRAVDGGIVGLCSYHKPLVDDPGGGLGRLVVVKG